MLRHLLSLLIHFRVCFSSPVHFVGYPLELPVMYGAVQVTKKIDMMVSVEAAQDSTVLSDDAIRKRITDQAEERIKQDCLELFRNYTERGIDLLNITADFQRKFPGVSTDGLPDKAHLDVEVHILIEGSQNINDAQ